VLGIILVDKPLGWTSFDVVNYVRKVVANYEDKKPKNIKVGHSGTLDPFATGLLILLVGKEYTKQASSFSKLDKTYEATIKLGESSSTGDPEGDITKVSDTSPDRSRIESVLGKLTGEISQTPPQYSAIKIDGKRAYKLAREGKTFKIKPRRVTIYSLKIVDYKYPELKITCSVSSGTYIRSLVKDIGRELGVGAYSKELRRIGVGKVNVSEAVGPEFINIDSIQQLVKEPSAID
jgi:tRNA pseudouridine55 synthase